MFVKKENALTVKLSAMTSCVSRENKVNCKLNLQSIIINVIRLAFMTSVYTTKNIVNRWKIKTLPNVNSIIVKNFIKNLTKYCQNILYQVKIFITYYKTHLIETFHIIIRGIYYLLTTFYCIKSWDWGKNIRFTW